MMKEITLTKEQTNQIVSKIKTYFTEELNQEIGGFEAEFLIDFFTKEIGPHYRANRKKWCLKYSCNYCRIMV